MAGQHFQGRRCPHAWTTTKTDSIPLGVGRSTTSPGRWSLWAVLAAACLVAIVALFTFDRDPMESVPAASFARHSVSRRSQRGSKSIPLGLLTAKPYSTRANSVRFARFFSGTWFLVGIHN